MKKKQNIMPALFFLAGAMLALSCTKEPVASEERKPDNTAKVHLSFAVQTQIYDGYATGETRGVSNFPVEHGKDDGTPDENKIVKFNVLLFKKEALTEESKLTYIYSFTPGNANPENALNGPFQQLGGAYQTPVKLIDPGKYILVVAANTTQFSKEQNAFKDLIADLVSPALEMTFAQFKEKTGLHQFHAHNTPRTDRQTGADFANGINASYVNENFDVPMNYTSKDNPYNVKINLARMLAKLSVTVDNLNDNGTQNTNSANYRISNIALQTNGLYKMFQSPSYWNTINDNTFYSLNIETLPGFKTYFPLLDELYNTAAFARRINETELFNFYLPPHGQGSPEKTETLNTNITIKVIHKTSGVETSYTLPLYNEVNGVKMYDIKPNTLYKLRLSFRGPTLVVTNINYQRVEWTSKTVNVPSFE